ncbi:MAG: hypothetical protein RLZ98_3496 [Pseudomonadota bacterium]|jgi:hypothetical protein
MDLQTQKLSGSGATRLTRILALSCFVVACALLASSLAFTSKAHIGLDASLMHKPMSASV